MFMESGALFRIGGRDYEVNLVLKREINISYISQLSEKDTVKTIQFNIIS